MLQYFLCFVQLTLKTSLGYWYKEWIKAKVKCTLYICTLKLPTKYKTFIINFLHYVTLETVNKIFFKEYITVRAIFIAKKEAYKFLHQGKWETRIKTLFGVASSML